jgi:hypothetical protein
LLRILNFECLIFNSKAKISYANDPHLFTFQLFEKAEGYLNCLTLNAGHQGVAT